MRKTDLDTLDFSRNMAIRNHLGLWAGNDSRSESCAKEWDQNPDKASMAIVEGAWQ